MKVHGHSGAPLGRIPPCRSRERSFHDFFVPGAALSLRRSRLSWTLARDVLFLAGLAVAFPIEILIGALLSNDSDQSHDLRRLAIMVIVCALIGLVRAWELIGAPSLTVRSEAVALGRDTVERARKPRRRDR